jgi:nicotinamidase-related amidase
VIHKGINPDVDSYSAFFDNAKLGKTNLEELIRKEVGPNNLCPNYKITTQIPGLH